MPLLNSAKAMMVDGTRNSFVYRSSLISLPITFKIIRSTTKPVGKLIKLTIKLYYNQHRLKLKKARLPLDSFQCIMYLPGKGDFIKKKKGQKTSKNLLPREG
jgi:hypothetical protein